MAGGLAARLSASPCIETTGEVDENKFPRYAYGGAAVRVAVADCGRDIGCSRNKQTQYPGDLGRRYRLVEYQRLSPRHARRQHPQY
jgi:hypothetical protein